MAETDSTGGSADIRCIHGHGDGIEAWNPPLAFGSPWICPRCNSVYGPMVQECMRCNRPHGITF